MEFYPSAEGKIALCLQSSMIAKEVAVQEMGIGEDLTFSLFGWVGDEMKVIATLSQQLMAEDPEKRFERVAVAATVLRKGWGCDALSFLAEAFCSMDAKQTAGKDLRTLFTKKGSPVHECLTVTHVDKHGVTLVTQPYRIGLGRKVEWLDTLMNEDAKGLRDAKYPAVLSAILGMDTDPFRDTSPEFYEALAEGMAIDGFHLQWTFY